MTGNENLAKQLRVLREEYARQLPAKISLIEQAFNSRDRESGAIQTLRFLAHGLAGSGTTFGFPKISQIALQAEVILDTILEEKRAFSDHEVATVLDLIELLKEMAKEPEAPMPMPRIAKNLGDGVAKKLIYLVEDDVALATEMSLQLGHFGFNVVTFESPMKLLKASIDPSLTAVLMDIVFPEGELAGTEVVRRLSTAKKLKVPVIFTSVRGDITARLSAVRAGAASYIIKPVETRSLVNVLDNLTSNLPPEPYRVLIVDDTQPLAEHYSYTLESAGILTNIVTDPTKILIQLADFRPDLIIMDIYMPGCTGAELAAVIRQFEDYLSVPIVFLSTEHDLDKQMTAMRLGGDDFLTKPIDSAHLVAAISTRLRRYRILRAHMDQDSLTGLLNHGTMRKHLSLETARAARQNHVFCFAMIDLDNFKNINDSYGHPVGDRVLQSLGALLRQRLRKSDIIGRVGGEEFAVILPNTKAEDAVTVLNTLRDSFGGISQRGTDKDFKATFSCGIVEYRRGESTESIYALADQALYQAKQAGRNQVVLIE